MTSTPGDTRSFRPAGQGSSARPGPTVRPAPGRAGLPRPSRDDRRPRPGVEGRAGRAVTDAAHSALPALGPGA
ncbi:hypothetical protein ABB07_24560 [Streptomyces incarnatus]|uniref:Uncharacterized protein n=1 Tax=Streptomyces incarnatus TaxID=665007 RepID=A0ABM5TQ28_9ACTN|nr:hypothetical protein [Streptomyces incarnatus]AKJ13090.1 hypothetical protein ABB07_24560 [Streptomyces incarnatus]